ncbi:hypothetical protein ACH5RR_016045 [Cinchona calisaya]|uniref:Uncharacterized protein n=1 Tax=Cinchona calisaya TaxID=153742 RepID=A0ABD2ZWU5_9GENT
MVFEDGYSFLVIFDVAKEVFRVTRLNEAVYSAGNLYKVGETLAVIVQHHSNVGGGNRIRLLFLEEHENQICVKQSIEFQLAISLGLYPAGISSRTGEMILVDDEILMNW